MSRKVFIKQLLLSPTPAVRPIDDDFATTVWIQGLVIATNGAEGWVRLDDGSGVLTVDVSAQRDLNELPALFDGQYVMLTVRPLPRVSEAACTWAAQRVLDLSADADAESLWLLEVLDLHQRLKLPRLLLK